MIEIQHSRGLHLPEADLWLDPRDSRPHAFVSHAHTDHFARHERILCTEATAVLLRARFRIAAERLETVAFHQSLTRGGFRLRLLPAGHITGSAMLHITRLKDNSSLLYTGDFKLRRGRTTEAATLVHADTLVMETTFGLPRFVLPPQMEIEMAVLRFVHDAFHDKVTPVLLAYSLGKAQEALALLHEHGIPALVHPAVAEMTEACRQAGVELPAPALLELTAPPGHAVIAPPGALRGKFLQALHPRRTVVLTGWALEPGAKFRHRTDEAIPLSDHADHPGLLECVQRVRPKRVLTVHGFAREFAAELRARGIEAWSAAGHDQLELSIRPAAARTSHGPQLARQSRPICPLADFSDVCRLVAETHSRVSKAGFLAAYLRGLESDADLRLATAWLANEALAPQARPRPSALASLVRQALLTLPGAREERHRELARCHPEPARAARALLQELPLKPEPADLATTAAFLHSFTGTAAAHERSAMLAARFATLHPAEAETMVRLLGNDLRLGIDAELLDDAIAGSCGANPEAIRRARLFTGSTAESAWLARYERLAEATLRPLTPVPFMTFVTRHDFPAQAPAEIPSDHSGWWLEPLCRGVRAHLHLLEGRVKLHTADRRAVENEFPDLAGAAAAVGADCILDGVLTTGNRSTPQACDGIARQAGHGRAQAELFEASDPCPGPPEVRFLAFDVLWLAGQDLTGLSLEERRAHLLSLHLGEPFDTMPVARPRTREEAVQAFAEALAQGFAGVVCKDPSCPHLPGQRSARWVAVKGTGDGGK